MNEKIQIGNYNFEIFNFNYGPLGKLTVTISFKRNTVVFSTRSLKYLTKPYVEIGYDADIKAIAIRPSEKTNFAQKLNKRGFLSNKKFCEMVQKISGSNDASKKYHCIWDEKEQMLIFEL